jgi:hypothetical protein
MVFIEGKLGIDHLRELRENGLLFVEDFQYQNNLVFR